MSASHTLHPRYRPDIDGLRAIAILAVVGFHAFPQSLGGGFVGVDVFFVISGFLISTIIFTNLEQGSFSYAEFYARRIRRIFPALALVLAACLVFGWFILLPDEYRELGRYAASGAGFVSNLLSWSDAGYFDKEAATKPLLHLWSLGVEEQFYIAWPILVGVCWRFRFNFLVVTLLVGIASLVLSVTTVFAYPAADFYSPLTRFWELMLGGVLAYLDLHRPELPLRRIRLQSLVGLALIVLAVGIIDKNRAFPGWWALLPTIGTLLVIASGPMGWVNRYVLGNPLMVSVGLISYPLYLWHLPLLVFALIIRSEPPPAHTRELLLIASFILATCTYFLVEKPVRVALRPRVAVPALLMTMVAVLAAALMLVQTDGVPGRFGPELQAYFRFVQDYAPGPDARVNRCWIALQAPADDYAADCIDPPQGGKPLLFLWGDSHAARLYPGLRAVAGDRYRLAQFTRNLCPAILGIGANPDCDAANQYVLARVRALKPAVVILFALWEHYMPKGEREPGMQELLATIAAIRQAGVPQVVVVGPAPEWSNTLPKDLLRDAVNHDAVTIPRRTFQQMDVEDVRSMERSLRTRLAGIQGVTYFSVYDVLCDESGCLTTLDGRAESLTAYDYGHLTTAGATYVARALLQDTVLR